MLAVLEGKSAELEKQIEDFRKKFCNTCEHEGGEFACTMMMRQWPDGECWRYRPREKKTKKEKTVDQNTETTGKSSTDEVEDQLPCKTCANAETCDRSHFYADNKDGYICEQKKELEEASV
jgi:hypothetical protein